MTRILTSALLAFGLIAGASVAQAADNPSPQNAQSSQNSDSSAAGAAAPSLHGDANHANLRQQLQSQLTGAGYSDIKITPSSFFIQAKDKSGNPVSMVVGPDSFTEVTTLDSNSGRAAAPSGSDAGSQNGTMAPQSPDSQQNQMGTPSTQKH